MQDALEYRRAVHLGGFVEGGVHTGKGGQVDDGAPAGLLPDADGHVDGAEHGALVEEVDAGAEEQVDEATGGA